LVTLRTEKKKHLKILQGGEEKKMIQGVHHYRHSGGRDFGPRSLGNPKEDSEGGKKGPEKTYLFLLQKKNKKSFMGFARNAKEIPYLKQREGYGSSVRKKKKDLH